MAHSFVVIHFSSRSMKSSLFLYDNNKLGIYRRPGQSRITTPRKETDTCKILSGIYDGEIHKNTDFISSVNFWFITYLECSCSHCLYEPQE